MKVQDNGPSGLPEKTGWLRRLSAQSVQKIESICNGTKSVCEKQHNICTCFHVQLCFDHGKLAVNNVICIIDMSIVPLPTFFFI